MEFKITLAFLLIFQAYAQPLGQESPSLIKVIDTVASLELRYLQIYKKLLQHKKSKLREPLEFSESEQQLIRQLQSQNEQTGKGNLYSWRYSLDLASLDEEVVSIHHLHLKDFLNFNDRNNHLFLAHIKSLNGSKLKLIDLSNVVHDTFQVPSGSNLHKI